jgi:hypothetical protein
MDGGSENANKYLLAFCELLIIVGLTDHIYLTRLPVGHTHEDIDGKFAKIWKCVRNEHIHSPQQYRKWIEVALTPKKLDVNKRMPVEIIDLFAIPDYKSFISDCIDKKLSGWTKEENTQLQWHFRKADDTEIHNHYFPSGCISTYRAYCCDKVFEVI